MLAAASIKSPLGVQCRVGRKAVVVRAGLLDTLLKPITSAGEASALRLRDGPLIGARHGMGGCGGRQGGTPA